MSICRVDQRCCKKYKKTITEYIYLCLKDLHRIEPFTYEDAELKYTDFEEGLRDRKTIAFSVLQEDKMTGIIWASEGCFRDDRKRLYINVVYVDKNHRGNGLGSQLLNQLKSYAKENDYHALFLELEAEKTDELNYYKEQGFTVERVQLVKNIGSDYMENPEIKRLTAERLSKDIHIFSNLFLQNLQAHVLTDSFDYAYALSKMQGLCDYLTQGKACCYFVEVNNVVAGFVWGYLYLYKSETRMLIAADEVCDEWCRCSIGRELIRYLEKNAYERGVYKIYTHTDGANKRGLNFHRALGFCDEEYQMVFSL